MALGCAGFSAALRVSGAATLAGALVVGLPVAIVFFTVDLLDAAVFFDNSRSLAFEFLARASVFAFATVAEECLLAGLALAVDFGTPLASVVPAVPLALLVVTSTFCF
jgi:hypothetical protein